MGDSRKAVLEDEDYWYDFKCQASIADVKWDVYSQEARYAKQGFEKHNLTGRRLKLFVKQQIEQNDLAEKHLREQEELAKLEELETKYK